MEGVKDSPQNCRLTKYVDSLFTEISADVVIPILNIFNCLKCKIACTNRYSAHL